MSVCSCQPGAQQPSSSCGVGETPALQQPQAAQGLQAAPCGDPGAHATPPTGTPGRPDPTASTPADRALMSLLVQLSGAELLLARWQLRDGEAQAVEEQQFPRMEGRDPGAVIAFLSASAAVGLQVCCPHLNLGVLNLGLPAAELGVRVGQGADVTGWLLCLAFVSTCSYQAADCCTCTCMADFVIGPQVDKWAAQSVVQHCARRQTHRLLWTT